MKTTYSAAEARSGFAKILNSVAYGGNSIIIKKYGEAIAKIVPVDPTGEKTSSPDFSSLISRYYGMWKGKSWAKDIGKPKRYFRKR